LSAAQRPRVRRGYATRSPQHLRVDHSLPPSPRLARRDIPGGLSPLPRRLGHPRPHGGGRLEPGGWRGLDAAAGAALLHAVAGRLLYPAHPAAAAGPPLERPAAGSIRRPLAV